MRTLLTINALSKYENALKNDPVDGIGSRIIYNISPIIILLWCVNVCFLQYDVSPSSVATANSHVNVMHLLLVAVT